MSLFFRETRSASAERFEAFASGNSPTPSSATHLVPVFASIRAIVDYVSTLPVDFYQQRKGDARVQVDMPPLLRNVDDEYGISNWFGQLAYAMVTVGNAVGEVAGSGPDGPLLIKWARHWSTDDTPGMSWWLDGKPLPSKLVAHVPWIVPAGRRLGMSPIEHYEAMVRAGLAAQEYANVGRGGGVPPTVITNKAMSEIPAQLLSSVKDAAQAAFRTSRPFVHGKDWELKVTDIPPNHLQFIETLKLTATQVAAIYGLDPREVGGSASDSLSYTNDESRALNRAHNMRPYLVRIENAVNRWLGGKTYMKFNIDATIRADIKTRTDTIGAKIQDGRLSVNEARALDDLSPVLGGDAHKLPTNESRSESAAKLIQQLYLGVGKVITLKEAREIINAAGGTDLDPGLTSDVVQIDLPPQPSSNGGSDA